MNVTAEESLFTTPIEVPEDFKRRAAERNWPDGLMQRAFDLRCDRGMVDFWLTDDFEGNPDGVAKFLDRKQELMFGTLRVREATWHDDWALAELYANSPEDIGEWEVTVERSPYPYAQFRLQEHVNMQVLEDRGVLLAVAAHSGRNTMIQGVRTTAHIATAWRTRKECRGKGYSQLLRTEGGPASAWFGMMNYWYFRSGNFDAFNWVKALSPEMMKAAPEADGDVPGQPVKVHYFDPKPFAGKARGIREATPADIKRCVALINRTHRGLDLFRPYSEDFLEMRLNDPYWDPKPPFWVPVYGWPDFRVLEEHGKIVACGGLWDRGKHIREVWVHKGNGERNVIECTGLMDFGYAAGSEDAMARLLEYFMGSTHELGRASMMAPIERLPKLVERMATHEPRTERRSLMFSPFNEGGVTVDVKIRRPYTDLAYW